MPLRGGAFVFLVLFRGLLVFSRVSSAMTAVARAFVWGGVAAVGGLLALALLLTTPSAVAQPWQDWRAWDPFRQGGSVYTFNWLQNYPKLLDPGNEVPIMSVRSDTPSYWRANALDTFTSTAWVASQAFLQRIDLVDSGGVYTFAIPPYEPTPAGLEVEQVFSLRSVYTNYLFVGGDPQSITLPANASLRINDMRSLHVGRALGPVLDYRVTAVVPDLKPEQLVGRGSAYPESVQRYLGLVPQGLRARRVKVETPRGRRRSRSDRRARRGPALLVIKRIVEGAEVPYEKTCARRHLRRSYSYTLSPHPVLSLAIRRVPFRHLWDTAAFRRGDVLLLRYKGSPRLPSDSPRDLGTAATRSSPQRHAWVECTSPRWVGWPSSHAGRNLPAAGPSSTSRDSSIVRDTIRRPAPHHPGAPRPVPRRR